MYSFRKSFFKQFLALAVLFLIPVSASAQKHKIETKKVLKDSIVMLLQKLDSMQKAYDEMVSAPFEEIAIAGDDDNFGPEDENDPFFNTDSALVAWYDNLSRHTQDEEELLEAGDMKYTSDIPDAVYIERLNRINTSVKIPYNDVVRSYIIYYTQKMSRAKVGRIVGLASYYMPIFEEIFDQYGLPQELAKVSVIESALNPMAVSRARAAGMWQFMRSTGTQYGLEVNEFVDERFDYIKETHAAAKYLVCNFWRLVAGHSLLQLRPRQCEQGYTPRRCRPRLLGCVSVSAPRDPRLRARLHRRNVHSGVLP